VAGKLWNQAALHVLDEVESFLRNGENCAVIGKSASEIPETGNIVAHSLIMPWTGRIVTPRRGILSSYADWLDIGDD